MFRVNRRSAFVRILSPNLAGGFAGMVSRRLKFLLNRQRIDWRKRTSDREQTAYPAAQFTAGFCQACVIRIEAFTRPTVHASGEPQPPEITMKSMMSACVAAVIFAIVPAQAEKLDLSTITCKQFFENTKSDATGVMLGWLHGYYRDDKDPPIINMDEFKSDLEKFGAFCAINPTLSIISAADKVFSK